MQRIEIRDEAMLCSGHAACPGCIDALSVRHVLAALGPDTMAVIPPSCMAIIAGPQPYSSLKIPVYQPTLEASAAAASGLRRALDAQGKLGKAEWVKVMKREFKFMGGEIVGEFLMSIGYLPGAHAADCPVYKQIARLKPAWMTAEKAGMTY